MAARRVCAWCHQDQGPAPSTFSQDTHGICPPCEALYFPENNTRPSAEESMKEKPAEIVITAPKGWGKGWLAERIAENVAMWKDGRVIIRDDGGIVETVDSPGRRRDSDVPTVAYITLKHQEG